MGNDSWDMFEKSERIHKEFRSASEDALEKYCTKVRNAIEKMFPDQTDAIMILYDEEIRVGYYENCTPWYRAYEIAKKFEQENY